jgi:hypothetical protein
VNRGIGKPWIVSYEQVLQHLLHAHGEHLRTTIDPLSLGDFVTVNYVNPLYARAKARPERAINPCVCADCGRPH